MKRIHPTAHRVLIKLKQVEEKSEGGIILHHEENKSRYQKAMQEAYVVELGPTAFKDFGDGAAWCDVGDAVFVARYSGEDQTDIEEGYIYRVINDEDIFATIEYS